MRDVLGRLRAALTPQAVLLLAGTLLLLAGLGVSSSRGGQSMTELERRISRTLSGGEGAGEVRVVILTRQTQQGTQSVLSGTQTQQQPSGAIAVAQGAGDPLVNLRLTQALCSLLGLPASAVSVMGGSGGE